MSFDDGRYRVVVHDGQHTLPAPAFDGSGVRFAVETLDGLRQGSAAYAVEGDSLYLAWAGASWRFDDTLREPPRRHQEDLTDGRLTAPMNGRVVAVHAQPGDKVDSGSPLVVLEAMKMEHALSLPVAVKVKAVHVSARMQVSPGSCCSSSRPTPEQSQSVQSTRSGTKCRRQMRPGRADRS